VAVNNCFWFCHVHMFSYIFMITSRLIFCCPVIETLHLLIFQANDHSLLYCSKNNRLNATPCKWIRAARVTEKFKMTLKIQVRIYG
jgi:membrane-anchored glycerophosphoryl diester phosphodiesterase (GDPDase)